MAKLDGMVLCKYHGVLDVGCEILDMKGDRDCGFVNSLGNAWFGCCLAVLYDSPQQFYGLVGQGISLLRSGRGSEVFTPSPQEFRYCIPSIPLKSLPTEQKTEVLS